MTFIRRLKRRFGITASRVAVRTRTPWYLRWGLIFGGIGLVIVGGWFMYDTGRSLAGFQSGRASADQAKLSEEIAHLRDENHDMRRQIAAQERQAQIEQSTHGSLATQMKTLTDENALLKEDLAFFQTLMTSTGESAGGVTINRFRVRSDSMPGEYRYQLLVVQARTRGKEFQGKLQLVVDIVQNGEARVLVLPHGEDKNAEFKLSFKFYQRVEGVFHLPPEAVVKRVSARVLENGIEGPRSSQTVNVS